jgi:hypothetical protein
MRPGGLECATHGVVIEHVPWSDGKRPVTIAMMCFLSRWARRLSWRETARAFHTSWECVYRSVEWFVQWGLVRIPMKSDTDSDFIRTAFRRMSDSVPEFAGQCSGDIRTAIRDGPDSVPDQSGHRSGVSGQFFPPP